MATQDMIHEFHPSHILCDVGLCKLGQGGFGCVLLGFHRRNNFVAVKCFKVLGGEREKLLIEKKIKHEYNMLLRSRHDNIATVYGYTKWPGAMGIVMQYYEGGNLRTLLLDEFINLGISLLLRVNAEIACGVSFIHNCSLKKRLIHGDLKPENILLTGDLHCKIADFGSAKTASYTGSTTLQAQEKKERPALTVIYAAPEKLLYDARLKKEQDIYSCGLIFFMSLSREEPFRSVQNYQDFRQMLEQGVRPNCEAIQELKDLCDDNDRAIVEVMERMMTRCWDQDPAQRPDMLEVHDEFQQHLATQDPAVISQQVADAVKEMDIKHPAADHNPTVPLHRFSTETGMFHNTGTEIPPRFEADQGENRHQASRNHDGASSLRRQEGSSTGSTESKSTKSQEANPPGAASYSNDETNPEEQLVQEIAESRQAAAQDSSETKPKLPLEISRPKVFGNPSDETNPKLLLGEGASHGMTNNSSGNTSSSLDASRPEMVGNSNDETNPKLLFTPASRIIGVGSSDFTNPRSQLDPTNAFLVIGGDGAETDCVKFDISTKRHQHLPLLNVGRCETTSVKVGTKIYVIGGAEDACGNNSHRSCEMLDIGEATEWVAMPDLLEPRDSLASAVLGDSIYVAGGRLDDEGMSSFFEFDIGSTQWLKRTNMHKPRSGFRMVAHENILHCIGGSHPQNYACEFYDLRIGQWQNMTRLKKGRYGLASVLLAGKIYSIGGWNGHYPMSSVECYDPIASKWMNVGSLNVGRAFHGACVVGGRIYAIGGQNSSGQTGSVEVFDPSSDSWSDFMDLDEPRYEGTVVAV